MADFSTRDDGTPTASHTWEEQFLPLREQGHKGPPPVERLQARIDQLIAACNDPRWHSHKARNGWKREVRWRVEQLNKLTALTEAGNGDAERQE